MPITRPPTTSCLFGHIISEYNMSFLIVIIIIDKILTTYIADLTGHCGGKVIC